MSIALRNYANSAFMIVIRVSTLIKKGVVIPADAVPMMQDAAAKLCKKQGCTFMGLELGDGIVRFTLEANPHVGDLGNLIGTIKSLWSRTLRRDFGLQQGVWLPRYLLVSDRPEAFETIEDEWVKKVTNTFADDKTTEEEPTDAD
jgi:hypothetical protein